MSQLPCVKAVDETLCVYIFKWKPEKNPKQMQIPNQISSVIPMWLFKR